MDLSIRAAAATDAAAVADIYNPYVATLTRCEVSGAGGNLEQTSKPRHTGESRVDGCKATESTLP